MKKRNSPGDETRRPSLTTSNYQDATNKYNMEQCASLYSSFIYHELHTWYKLHSIINNNRSSMTRTLLILHYMHGTTRTLLILHYMHGTTRTLLILHYMHGTTRTLLILHYMHGTTCTLLILHYIHGTTRTLLILHAQYNACAQVGFNSRY